MARGFGLFPQEPIELPQFGGGALPVRVRNTFLHIDDTPSPQQQSRHKSAPPEALRRAGSPSSTGWGDELGLAPGESERRRFATHAGGIYEQPATETSHGGHATGCQSAGATGLQVAAVPWPSLDGFAGGPFLEETSSSQEALEGWAWGPCPGDAWPPSLLGLVAAAEGGGNPYAAFATHTAPPPALPPSLPPQLQQPGPAVPTVPACIPAMPRLSGALGGANTAPAFVPQGHALPVQSKVVPSAPQPQTLTRAIGANTREQHVFWTVDARKLKGNDKQAVSPPFELCFGHQREGNGATFKIMLYPKLANDSRGSSTFKRCNGRGFILLKCEADVTDYIVPITFRIAIGVGNRRQPARGPVTHDFSKSAVGGLRRFQEEWCFNDVVDLDSMTFVVCLEIVPSVATG